MKRRTLLLGGAGVAGACVLGYGGTVAAGSIQGCAGDEERAALAERSAIASLGLHYLTQASPLERAELTDMAQGPVAAVAETAAGMAARAGEDFEAGDVVDCAGWVLARGEARASALIALAYARTNTLPLPF